MEGHRRFWPKGRFSPLQIAGMIAGGFVLAAGFAFFFGWIVMLLWNWLMPEIFRLPEIGYWQAWGLVLLSHILVKPGYGPAGKHRGDEDRREGDWRKELKDKVACAKDSAPEAEAKEPGAEDARS